MTSFIPGAPDYQLQQAPSTNLLVEAAYSSIADPVVIDLSALVLPHHQGLAFQWVQSAGDPAGTVTILTTNDGFQAILIPPCTLGASQIAPRPLLGAAYVQGTPSTLALTVTRAAGINNLVGSIRVFGLTVLPLASEWNLPGIVPFLAQADSTAIAAGTTVTVLAAPAAGFAYKIKRVCARANAAPAAGAAQVFSTSIAAVAFARYTTTAVANDSMSEACDFWTTEGVSFANGSGVGWRAQVTAEEWQLT